jgi:hypothetical protein
MTESNKKKIGIIGIGIILLSLILYSSIVVAEFYVSKYGEVVDAKVTDVSKICRGKKKYVTLLIGSKYERIKLYGISCRRDEFLLGSIIQVRRSKRLDIVTIPNNLGRTRLIFFPLFTAVVLGFFISSIKKGKKSIFTNG